MPGCRHESLEYIGDQRTDSGVNAYLKCKSCGAVLTRTPSGKVIAVKGVQPKPQAKQGTGS
jgi:hypothetical protein